MTGGQTPLKLQFYFYLVCPPFYPLKFYYGKNHHPRINNGVQHISMRNCYNTFNLNHLNLKS